jgi:hypothetical protein
MVDTSTRASEVRGWGLAGGLGALGYLGASLVGTVDPRLDETTGWLVAAAVSALLLVGGPVGVARAGAAGPGALGRIGLAVAGAGWVLVGLGHTVAAVVGLEAVALYVTGTALLFAGPIAAGIAVVRAGMWRGPARWALLACGLAVAVVSPFFGRDDALAAAAGAAWMISWLWLAAVLLTARR